MARQTGWDVCGEEVNFMEIQPVDHREPTKKRKPVMIILAVIALGAGIFFTKWNYIEFIDVSESISDISFESLSGRLKKRIAMDRNELQSTSLVIYKYSDSIVSAKFTIVQYYEGAAHPNNSVVAKTYDAFTGDELKLDHFILQESDRDKLKDRVYEYLIQDSDVVKDIDDELWIKDLPTDEMLKNFVVTENVIYFYFNGVVPHALGEKSVPVLIDSIDGWINPKSSNTISLHGYFFVVIYA